MNLLIDGDIVVYRAACAVQTAVYMYVDDEGYTEFPGMTKKEILEKFPDLPKENLQKDMRAGPVSHALQICKNMVANIIQEVKDRCDIIDKILIYITADDKSNFRYQIAKTKPYKGNRTEPKPIHYDAVRQYLLEKHKATLVSGMEADDAIGIEATQNESIIASIDKDLDMIPGKHYNFVKKVFYYVNADEADYNFFRQMLTGDTVDNIPGVPGIGPKKADNLLKSVDGCPDLVWEYGSYWTVLEHITYRNYQDRGLDAAYFNEMADLIWIRRYNQEKAPLNDKT